MLTQERLKELLHYNPETGLFTRLQSISNRTKIGDIAGNLDKSTGYMRIYVDDKRYYAHRLAIFYMTGEWPPNDGDHENNIRHDNKWDNIRNSTRQQNGFNRGANSNNSLGVKGVRKNKYAYTASIYIDNKLKHLGSFKTLEEADLAYKKAANEIHGEFVHRTIKL